MKKLKKMKLANKCSLQQLTSEMPVMDTLDQAAIFGGVHFDIFFSSFLNNEWQGGYVDNLGYIGQDGNFIRQEEDWEPYLWSLYAQAPYIPTDDIIDQWRFISYSATNPYDLWLFQREHPWDAEIFLANGKEAYVFTYDYLSYNQLPYGYEDMEEAIINCFWGAMNQRDNPNSTLVKAFGDAFVNASYANDEDRHIMLSNLHVGYSMGDLARENSWNNEQLFAEIVKLANLNRLYIIRRNEKE